LERIGRIRKTKDDEGNEEEKREYRIENTEFRRKKNKLNKK